MSDPLGLCVVQGFVAGVLAAVVFAMLLIGAFLLARFLRRLR